LSPERHLATRPERGWKLRRYCPARTGRHTDQQNEGLPSVNLQRVRVTLPRHPLLGQTLEIVREIHGDGGHRLVVKLPDGHTQLMPATWTDAETSTVHHQTESPLLFTPGSLRSLVRMVVHIRGQRQPEAYDDSPNDAPGVDYLQPRDAPADGVSMDRSVAAPDPSASAVSERTGR